VDTTPGIVVHHAATELRLYRTRPKSHTKIKYLHIYIYMYIYINIHRITYIYT
jgi:hypothetical protein